MNKKKLLSLTLAAVMAFSFGGCGKKDEEETTTEATTEYSITTEDDSVLEGDLSEVELTRDGKVQSDLNGEWVDKAETTKRPLSITINNIYASLPQSGISEADVIFEMLEEHRSVTRFLCVFSNYEQIEKLGPVRSARHYFDRKAMELDAYFAHWGQSVYAQHEFEVTTQLDQIDLNGKDGGAAFRANRPGYALEHTGYTSGQGLAEAIKNNGFSTEKDASYKKMFYFNPDDIVPEGGKDCNKVTTAFNQGLEPYFTYDSENKVYKRFENGAEQIDENTGAQLTFKNIIIQYAPHRYIEGDESGCLDIELTGSGEGYYISDGKVIPITWKKDASASYVDYTTVNGYIDENPRTAAPGEFGTTQYYTEDGEMLKLNPGKTFVTIFPDDKKDGIILE